MITLSRLLPFALLTTTLSATATHATSDVADASSYDYAAVPQDALQQGQEAHQALASLSGSERLLSHLFGTDCYTKALHALGKDCRALSESDRGHLAVAMANCFLRQTGLRTYKCSPAMTVQQCTVEMVDVRAFNSYSQFYVNIHSVCLYLQNQDFQRQTEALVNTLKAGGELAAERLTAIGEHLQSQQEHVGRLAGSMGELAGHQEALAHEVSASARGLATLSQQAAGLEAQMSASLVLAEDVRARQEAVARDVAALETASHALIGHTERLRGSVEVVLHYERRGDAVLSHLLGRSYTLSDAAYYVLAAAAILAVTGSVASASLRAPLLVLLAVSLAGERQLAQWVQARLGVAQDGQVVMDATGMLLSALAAWLPVGLGAQAMPLSFVKWCVRGSAMLAAAILWSRSAVRQLRQRRDVQKTLGEVEQRLQELSHLCGSLVAQHNSLLAPGGGIAGGEAVHPQLQALTPWTVPTRLPRPRTSTPDLTPAAAAARFAAYGAAGSARTRHSDHAECAPAAEDHGASVMPPPLPPLRGVLTESYQPAAASWPAGLSGEPPAAQHTSWHPAAATYSPSGQPVGVCEEPLNPDPTHQQRHPQPQQRLLPLPPHSSSAAAKLSATASAMDVCSPASQAAARASAPERSPHEDSGAAAASAGGTGDGAAKRGRPGAAWTSTPHGTDLLVDSVAHCMQSGSGGDMTVEERRVRRKL